MIRLLKNLTVLIVLGAIIFHFRVALVAKFLPVWNDIKSYNFAETACQKPIPYFLGAFDSEFGISQKYFLDALLDAEAIWEKPFGKELFYHESESLDDGNLKINLIYDYRQQATDKLASLGIVVENDKAFYESLKAKFTTLKAQYEREKVLFDSRVGDFSQRQKVYEQKVGFWNQKGGAPKAEYDKLESERSALNAEAEKLQRIQANINGMADEINALVVVLNRLITSLNLSVEKYNTTNIARGESFEEGVFTQEGSSRQIDIYEFSSREKLVRVLAHELGHALGIEHVDDPNAIMYMLNQKNSLTLAKSDLSALKEACGN